MAFDIDIKERNLASNPIMLKINSDEKIAVNYTVLDENDNEFYTGIISLFAASVEIDINFLFGHLKTRAGVENYFVSVVDADEKLTPQKKAFKVFGGGISKQLTRELAGINTDIFEWKLKNSKTNFLLTTRSNGQVILIPENELMPIGCYPAGMKFNILANGANVEIFDFSADLIELYKLLDFSTFRKKYFDNSGRLCSEFIILDSSNIILSVRIVIIEAKATDYFLKFKNSFGEFERIALYGAASYKPAFDEKEDIESNDPKIKALSRKQQRKRITHSYQAESGYRPASDRLFILDMLLSDEVYFIVKDREYSAKVSSETELFDSTNGEPINIQFTIELLDTDTIHSPLNYGQKSSDSLLTDNSGNLLTDNSGNLLTSN